MAEPGGRIGLIDFGMVGEVDDALRQRLGVLLAAGVSLGDRVRAELVRDRVAALAVAQLVHEDGLQAHIAEHQRVEIQRRARLPARHGWSPRWRQRRRCRARTYSAGRATEGEAITVSERLPHAVADALLAAIPRDLRAMRAELEASGGGIEASHIAAALEIRVEVLNSPGPEPCAPSGETRSTSFWTEAVSSEW
jgi:hypothetical protein